MEYISCRENNGRITRTLEEYAESFYYEMKFEKVVNEKIFRVLKCCEDKMVCYRSIDETLKVDLESQHGDYSKMVLGKNWFISAIQYDKHGNGYIFALHNGIAESMTMEEYAYYQIDCFFESLIDLIGKQNGDTSIFIINMIYENAIAFVDKKISDIINMAMSPHVVLAENISKISYLPYEGNKVNYKYMVWGIDKRNCDITFVGHNITLDNHKQIRKLLEINYKEKNSGLYLVCNGARIEGYISPKNLEGEFYLVEFNGTGKWSFCYQGSNKKKIIFSDKRVDLFKDDDKKKFSSYYKAMFGNETNIENIWPIVESAKGQKHGTMLLFTENALKETERLHSAGYQVSIREDMNARWIEAIGKIDGAMLLDQYGKLYMVGVILDGEIPAKGVNTSRGARYNSAVKYSYSHKKEKHLLVVISEDGYFDVINYNWLL